MQRFVIMGVAGSGKSTVGAGLTGIAYVDGDDLHPSANIAKMRAGVPLTDADRAPWLRAVGQRLAVAQAPLVIGCSALKRQYRDIIRAEAAAPVGFIHLAAPIHVIVGRLSARTGHFMPTSLLDSQFADLEPLGPEEAGVVIDIDQDITGVVTCAQAFIDSNL